MDDDRDFEAMAPGDEAPPGTEGTGEDICPQCGGDGRDGDRECRECAGSGRVVRGVGGA
jgi:DnaJ-class molecular chaperone